MNSCTIRFKKRLLPQSFHLEASFFADIFSATSFSWDVHDGRALWASEVSPEEKFQQAKIQGTPDESR